MATQDQYGAGEKALAALIDADMGQLPFLLRQQIPAEQLSEFVRAGSRAVIDAVIPPDAPAGA